jgi:flavin reductase (DIM6/NTAB) family NADH-FMN oxidoreductase RutF
MFVPATTREGRKKDTLLNIEQVPEFVVNLVSDALASRMNDTASLLPYGESEFEAFGISPLPSTKVKPPRVSDSPVSFECVLDRIVTIGSGPFSGNVVFGRVVAAHVRDDVVGVKGLPESAKLDLVGRLGGEDYTRTRDTFGLRRPDLR